MLPILSPFSWLKMYQNGDSTGHAIVFLHKSEDPQIDSKQYACQQIPWAHTAQERTIAIVKYIYFQGHI